MGIGTTRFSFDSLDPRLFSFLPQTLVFSYVLFIFENKIIIDEGGYVEFHCNKLIYKPN